MFGSWKLSLILVEFYSCFVSIEENECVCMEFIFQRHVMILHFFISEALGYKSTLVMLFRSLYNCIILCGIICLCVMLGTHKMIIKWYFSNHKDSFASTNVKISIVQMLMLLVQTSSYLFWEVILPTLLDTGSISLLVYLVISLNQSVPEILS